MNEPNTKGSNMRKKLVTKVMLGGLAIGLGAIITQAAAPAAPQGFITGRAFTDISGTVVTDLTGNPKFPDSPDAVRYEPYFEWNAGGDISVAAVDWADNYGVQMLGYFYPATTGNYTFYLSADDGAQLWLSTDADPANKKLIAQESGWSAARSYTVVGGGSVVEEKNSSTFAASQWPGGGTAISLVGGQPYYIEALMKEGGGGDNLSVSLDGSLPIPGNRLSTIDKTMGPLVIVTQPQSQTVGALAPVTFSVGVDGTPPYTFQWKRDGADIEGATGAAYTIDRVLTSDNGAVFTVAITGGQGSLTSAPATLTVVDDATAPELANVTGSATFTLVKVTFSEPVDETTSQATANYQLSGGVTISGATRSPAPNDNIVVLNTSVQAEGTDLTLTVNNVQDLSGNPIAAGTEYTFQTFVWASGVVLHEYWENVTANNIAGLTNDVRFPGSPSWVTLEPMFEYPANGGNEGGSNYGNKISCWFSPATTDEFIFYICSDDPGNLYISTDADPANKVLVAQETGWSNARTWSTAGSGDATSKATDTFLFSEWPGMEFPAIAMTAGQKYYIEALHTEGGGGDNLGVTFGRFENYATPPATGTAPALAGDLIGTYVDMNGAAVTVTQQPQSATIQQNTAITLTVAATSTSAYGADVHSYQWQSAPAGSAAFVDIAGATQPIFTTPLLTMADNGTQYRAVINLLALTETTDVAVITVSADLVPPTVVSAGALQGDNQVGVWFSEVVNTTSAQTAANYQVSGATVSSVVLHMGRLAQLNLAGAVPASFTVTVNNVTDLAGNAMASSQVTGEISTMTAQDIGVPGTNPLLPGAAFAFGGGGHYVAGGGTDIWDNADGFHYVYRQFSGAFDMRANVMSLKGTHQWAKAGLMVRESLTPGSRHADVVATRSDPADPAATPPIQTPQNQINVQWRDTTDGASASIADADRINIVNNANYPNLWLRLVREDAASNEIKAFWSNNGTSWSQFPAYTMPVPALPANVYVGMAVTSHDNNPAPIPLAEAIYNGFSVTEYQAITDPQLAVTLQGNNVVITWQAGTLVSSPTVTGTYAPVTGATTPYQVTPTAGATFYRVQQ